MGCGEDESFRRRSGILKGPEGEQGGEVSGLTKLGQRLIIFVQVCLVQLVLCPDAPLAGELVHPLLRVQREVTSLSFGRTQKYKI